MILKIGTKKISRFNAVDVTLKYDSVASTFAFQYFYDPNDTELPELSELGAFRSVTVEDEGELLLTGTLLSHGHSDAAEKQLSSVSGYSTPGVLEDCEIPPSAYPLQSDGKTLRQIVSKLIQPFGISLIVDSDVAAASDGVIVVSTAESSGSVKAYLAELATQKNIILSHDASGNLLMTRSKPGASPTYSLSRSQPVTGMSLTFNGQALHSEITVMKQADSDGGNAGQAAVSNPYVIRTFRPSVKTQTSGTDVSTPSAARSALSDELRAIALTINLSTWRIDNKLIRPNTIVTILNPEIGIKKSTNWFIESVQFTGNETAQTCVLQCVLPEVHNSAAVKNIFL